MRVTKLENLNDHRIITFNILNEAFEEPKTDTAKKDGEFT